MTPDELLADFDAGAQGRADVDMRGTLLAIIEDICTSYMLAMRAKGLDAATREQIDTTIRDYVVNHYGDD